MWLTAVGLLIGLTVFTWWLLARGTSGVDVANVLALPVGALGLGVAAVGLVLQNNTPDRLDRLVAHLTRLVDDQESRALAQMLGDSGDPRPADVEFRRSPQLCWRTDGGAEHGSLDDIAGYYLGLDRGRLIVLGEPGSGKTVLAVKLVRDLIALGSGPVPVRLSLPTFDPTTTRLDAWLADQLAKLGVPPKLARQLVTERRILPVLDGLDEMDPDDRSPERASAVLRMLDTARPVVLTCRHKRYQELLNQNHSLQDATPVLLERLRPDTVRAYLTRTFPDPHDARAITPRWRTAAQALAAHSPTPLAEALCSPWHLFLCTSVFRADGDPAAQLADLNRAQLTNALLTRLIPATIAHHPKPDDSRFDAGHVRRWLTTLAVHMGTGSDITLNRLWRIAGTSAPRYAQCVAITLLLAIPVLIGIGPIGAAIVAAAGLIPLAFRPFDPRAGQLDLAQLRLPATRRKMARNVMPSIIWAGLSLLFIAKVIGISRIVVALVMASIVGILLVELLTRIDRVLTFVTRPSAALRQAALRDAAGNAVFAFIAGAVTFVISDSAWSTTLIAALTAAALFSGLMMSTRYVSAMVIVCGRGDLPWRPARFLDWAYDAGLLRLAGAGIQFRHREFQEWLVARE